MAIFIEKLERIRDLALLYQKTRDQETFQRIIERIDNLIIYAILPFYYRYNFIGRPDLQDLYQTGLVGVYKMVEKVREEDEVAFIPLKVITYVRNEIAQSYTLKEKERDAVKKSFCVKENYVSNEDVFKKMESEDIQKVFGNLISNGVISQEDFDLLVDRFVEEMSINEIVRTRKYGKHWSTINKRIQKVLGKIRNVISEDLKEDLGS